MKKLFLLFVLFVSLNGVAQQYRYFKAQLHCHSTNSDGVMNPQTVAQEYLSRGYEILFITDHNFMTPDSSYSQPGLLTINGEELTFNKHMNGFFLNHTVDATGFTPQQAIDSVRALGGLIQFNHPVVAVSTDFPYYSDWSYSFPQFMALHDGPDFIEVHNAGTDLIHAYFDMSIWDSLLINNRKIWGTATDDMHHLTEVGLQSIDIGWIMIRLNTLSEDSVRAALLRGDFYGSTGVDITNYSVEGNTINISSLNATTIKFIGDHGQVLSTVNGTDASFTRTTQRYIRIELVKAGIAGIGDKYAFTQPLFFEGETNTSISSESTLQKSLSSYPNPAENNINICFYSEKTGDAKINIFDVTGQRVVSEISAVIKNGYNEIPVNISQLNEGIYIYTIENNGVKITRKFTKI